MAEPFLSEIRLMSFSFAPKGWALCNGQLLPINQNQALFSLLGTTYGGDGRVNFGLPNLQGGRRSTWAAASPSASGAARRPHADRSRRSRPTSHMRQRDPSTTATLATDRQLLAGRRSTLRRATGITSLLAATRHRPSAAARRTRTCSRT